jgi:hypothetical protein
LRAKERSDGRASNGPVCSPKSGDPGYGEAQAPGQAAWPKHGREILRNSVKQEDCPAGGLGSRIAALFRKAGLRGDIPELHEIRIEPADFGK